MRRQNLPLQRLMSQDSFSEVAPQLRYEDVTALYAAVGEGHVSTQSVIEKVTALVSANDTDDRTDRPAARRPLADRCRGSDSGVLVRGAPTSWSSSPSAARPVPGDPIVGFVTRGQRRLGAPRRLHNVKSLMEEPERLIEVEWAPTHEEHLPRADPGRGARSRRPAQRRDAGALASTT